jgi:hypothetical protein
VAMIVPYPGSEIYRKCLETGLVKDKESFLYSLGGFDKLRVNMTGMSDRELLGHQERLSMEIYSYLLQEKQAVIHSAECTDDHRSTMEFSCPTCGNLHRAEIAGFQPEIGLYCQRCCYPVYFHPWVVPHIRKKTLGFQDWVTGLRDNPDVTVMATPVGHDFMRMSAAYSFPMEKLSGFLDQSVQRLKHPFMDRPVYLRNEESLRMFNPDYLIVCSFAYQDDIIGEMKKWTGYKTKIIPMFG